MLIPVSYSCRNFYLAVARFVSLWLVQVRESQSNARQTLPNDLRRSFQTVTESNAPVQNSGLGHWMNRAFMMRFAAFTNNENLNILMRQDNQQRRRPRGGSRRPRRGNYDSAPAKAPEKQTFFQKIASFFTGSKKQSNGNSVAEPSRRSPQQQPERSERSERFSRKPEIIEVNSPKLYVGNLSFDASESDLFELFNGVGKVQNAEIVSNKYTQKSKGFAFVTLQTVDEARRAVTELHDKEFMGRKLVVSGAKTSDAVSTRESSSEEQSN
jgi:hypothetical protein